MECSNIHCLCTSDLQSSVVLPWINVYDDHINVVGIITDNTTGSLEHGDCCITDTEPYPGDHAAVSGDHPGNDHRVHLLGTST